MCVGKRCVRENGAQVKPRNIWHHTDDGRISATDCLTPVDVRMATSGYMTAPHLATCARLDTRAST